MKGLRSMLAGILPWLRHDPTPELKAAAAAHLRAEAKVKAAEARAEEIERRVDRVAAYRESMRATGRRLSR